MRIEAAVFHQWLLDIYRRGNDLPVVVVNTDSLSNGLLLLVV